MKIKPNKMQNKRKLQFNYTLTINFQQMLWMSDKMCGIKKELWRYIRCLRRSTEENTWI